MKDLIIKTHIIEDQRYTKHFFECLGIAVMSKLVEAHREGKTEVTIKIEKSQFTIKDFYDDLTISDVELKEIEKFIKDKS